MATAIQKIINQALTSRIDARRKPVRGVRFPTSLAVTYMRWIRAYARELRHATDEWVQWQLKPALALLEYEQDGLRQDSVENIEQQLDNLSARFATVMTDEAIRQYIYEHSREILAYTKRQWIRSIHAITGVDPLLHDAVMERIVKAHVRENVSLIKSIPQKYYNDIDRVVMSGVRSGSMLKDIEQGIKDVYPPNYDRASLIARDQTGSLNAAIVDEQYKQANLTTYVWRCMQDSRVRGNPLGKYPNATYSHWDREGKVFSVDDPPPDGHPGEPIQCRCFRQVQESEVLGKEEETLKPGQQY